ncbi:hypothetical protein O181_050112 [Austropuccinia psidii MF-1]|uniref:Pectinesterase n=1 Tax=Austropuccinia psidii MF-1 TaxID=1389203 RepID=A0A9Q3DYB1_9BASI|nr:hypothetical protein [Austropuccinia psidii MF-1]
MESSFMTEFSDIKTEAASAEAGPHRVTGFQSVTNIPKTKMLHHNVLSFVFTFLLLYSSYLTQVLGAAAGNCPRFGYHYSSSTRPHPNALVVRKGSTNSGEYPTISAAVDALEGFHGPRQIFIYPGNYPEHVHIKSKHPLRIQGFTKNSRHWSDNQVTVNVAISAKDKNGNAESSGVWVSGSCFEMRNVNVINSFGTGTDTQAVALTASGEEHIYRMCAFSSYQDTLYVETNKALFYRCHVEGAVDFIFGTGTAWFEHSYIAVKPPRAFAVITAQRSPPDVQTIFVFNRAQVYGLPGTQPNSTYLGRPWSSNAAVVFQFSRFSDIIKPQGWKAWKSTDPRTENIHFQEFENIGPGSRGTRDLARMRNEPLSIRRILGDDFLRWAS